MPLDSQSYVARSSDKALLDGLLAGKYCYVLNSRQMGKSSLSVRVISRLEQAGVRTVLVDLTRIGGRNVTPVQWYAGLCDAIGASLNLQSEMLDYFRQNSLLSPMQRFFGAIEHIAMVRNSAPITVLIDEIDTTKNLSFEADEFFAGIRECFNRRVQDPAFNRLCFCLIGVAVPTDLISNPSTTPFNVGERIQLNDFTLEEVQSLAGPLGANGAQLLERVHHWTAGQPFLTQSLCEAIASDPLVQTQSDVDALVQSRLLERRARTTNINLADVGDRALNSSDSDSDPNRFRAELLSTYERAWRGGFVPDDESNRIAVVLKLSGLVKSDGRRLEVRNRIYREVFNRKWIEDNMPERALMRERQAFRRGIIRAASASAAVIAIVCALGLFAWKSGIDAVSSKRMLDYELYVSDMNNMRLLEEIGDIARMDAILKRTAASPYRGFEWSFWLGRVHDSKEEYTLDYTAPGKREEGTISADGKSVCVYDSLLGVAAIIDRQSHQTIAVRQVGRRARIVATRAGFVSISDNPKVVEITDVITGRNLANTRFGADFVGVPVFRPRSDYGIALLRNPTDGNAHDVVLWDLLTGRIRYEYRSKDVIHISPLTFNDAGTRILFGTSSAVPTHKGWQIWTVRDTTTDQECDSFEVPPVTGLSDFSESGRRAIYRDPQHRTICRSIDDHRNVLEREWDGGDIPTASFVTLDDKAAAETFGNGRATLVELSGKRDLNFAQNVWGLTTTDSPDTLLSESTSVRVLDKRNDRTDIHVVPGARLSRDDLGNISLFHERPYGIWRYSDPDFRPIGHTEQPPRLRGGFPYNGLWRMCSDSTGKVGLFSDADGHLPPVRISPIPVNYSCGSTRDSLVVLERKGHRIDGIDGSTGRIRWSYDVKGNQVSGLWVTPKGDTALALTADVDLLALDVRTGKLRSELGGHNVRITNLTFTRNGDAFFTCGFDGRVILWDLKTLQMVKEFRGNAAQKMSSADLSPDGSRVATCNYTGSWQLWDAKSGVQLMDIHGSTLPLRSILFTSDGSSLITAGDDLQVRRWTSLNEDSSVKVRIDPKLLKGIAR